VSTDWIVNRCSIDNPLSVNYRRRVSS